MTTPQSPASVANPSHLRAWTAWLWPFLRARRVRRQAPTAPDLFLFLKLGSQRFTDRLILPLLGISFFLCAAYIVRDIPAAMVIACLAATVAATPYVLSHLDGPWRVPVTPPALGRAAAPVTPSRPQQAVLSDDVWKMVGTAHGVAALLIVILTSYVGGDPARSSKLTPLFLPVVIALTHAYRRMEDPGRRFSLLTLGLGAYCAIAAFLSTTAFYYVPADRLMGGIRLYLVDSPLASLWALSPFLVLYYAMRNGHLVMNQAESLYEINRYLARLDDPRNQWQGIAALLRTRLSCERLLIVEPDEHYYRKAERVGAIDAAVGSMLHVVGAAGRDEEQAMTFTYDMDSGVSYRAFKSKTFEIIPDVRKEPSYVPVKTDEQTRAELVVPVFDIDRPDLLLAIILLQSSRLKEFSPLDGQRVKQFATYIEFFYRSSRTPLTFYRRLRHEMKAIQGQSYLELIEATLHAGRRLFSTEKVGFIHLGVGTGVPLSDAADALRQRTTVRAIPGSFSDGCPTATRPLVEEEVDPLAEAIERWEPIYFDKNAVHLDSNSADTIETYCPPEAWRCWADQEKLQEIALVPVGSRAHQLGLLVVGFGQEHQDGFRSSLLLFLSSFAESVGPRLASASYIQQTYDGFLRPRLHLHRYLGEANLSRGEIERQLRQLSVQNDNPTLKDVLSKFQTAIDRVYGAEAVMLPIFEGQNAVTLESALNEFREDLYKFKYGDEHNKRQNTRMVFRIDREIQQESPTLNTILYRLITEAMINAVTHGKASDVVVRVMRLRHAVTVTMRDTGAGFDPATLVNRPRHPGDGGIVALASQIETLCGGAPIDWFWTAKGKGTVCKISIPLRPCETAPIEPHITGPLDQMEAQL